MTRHRPFREWRLPRTTWFRRQHHPPTGAFAKRMIRGRDERELEEKRKSTENNIHSRSFVSVGLSSTK